MKRFARRLAIVLAVAAILAVSAFAADFTHCADALHDLGLFQGTDSGYDLDRAPTRAEAAAMLVRLLGAEEEAQAMESYTAPFTDVRDWAKPYVQYLYDNGLTEKTELAIETLSGIKYLKLHVEKGTVKTVTVDMGVAELRPSQIPVAAEGDRFVDRQCQIAGGDYRLTCVSMGNPHAVVFVDDPDGLDLETLGPKFEWDPLFPDRVNTEFVKILDETTIQMRVWERGSGETYACGTGACASTVAAILNGHCPFDREVTVKLKGGDLTITVTKDYHVFMTGSATKVYEGVYEYEDSAQ